MPRLSRTIIVAAVVVAAFVIGAAVWAVRSAPTQQAIVPAPSATPLRVAAADQGVEFVAKADGKVLVTWAFAPKIEEDSLKDGNLATEWRKVVPYVPGQVSYMALKPCPEATVTHYSCEIRVKGEVVAASDETKANDSGRVECRFRDEA